MKKQRDTPQWLAEKMAVIALNHIYLYIGKNHFSILEPSAGDGKIVDSLIRFKPTFNNVEIKCVELNEEKCNILKNKGYNAFRADFLQWEPDFDSGVFDAIVAAPPFINNSDVDHIQKMYRHLGLRGIIVTLTTPLWTVNNEPHQVKFREWLKDKNYEMTMLPDDTFVEKGKTVPTALLIIRK